MTQQPVAPPSAESFFQGLGERHAPPFKFEGINDGLMGEVTDVRVTQVVVFASNPIKYEFNDDGTPKYQLEVTIQTAFRGWAKCSSIPSTKVRLPNGQEIDQPEPAEKDDGKRRVFVKGNMAFVVGRAVHEAGDTTVVVGSTLGVKLESMRDTGKGNPLKEYAAMYTPRPAAAGFFQAPQAAPPQYAPPQQAYAPPVMPQPQPVAYQAQPQPYVPPQGVQPQQQQAYQQAQQAAPAADPWAPTAAPTTAPPPF